MNIGLLANPQRESRFKEIDRNNGNFQARQNPITPKSRAAVCAPLRKNEPYPLILQTRKSVKKRIYWIPENTVIYSTLFDIYLDEERKKKTTK